MSSSPVTPLAGTGPKCRMADLERLLGSTRNTIRKMVQRGDFPRGVRVNARVHVWPEAQVRGWIAAREAEARNGQ